MIRNETPLSMPESLEYVKNDEMKAFIKTFTKLNETEGKELREKLVELGFVKLNAKQISKIIDLLPGDKEDLLKIVFEANLDQEEIEKILSVVREYA